MPFPPHPGFNVDGEGRPACPLERCVAGDLVSNVNGLVEFHAINGNRDDACPCQARRMDGASHVHLTQHPATKNVTCRIGIARHGNRSN